MNDFDLKDLGHGKFALSGEMSFDTADRILGCSERPFNQYESLEVDLSQVDKADSAGLALLLEWKAQAKKRAARISFSGLPDSLRAIALTTQVSDLI